jgi:hypothetical protein
MKKKIVVRPIEVLEENLAPVTQDNRKNATTAATSPGGFMVP